MKRYVLAVLMLAATTASTLAAEKGKVVQVIYIGADGSGALIYDQIDETGAIRRCSFAPGLNVLLCSSWAKAS